MKVHFAGCENQQWAKLLCGVAGVTNGLFSVFPFIAEKHGLKPVRIGDDLDIVPYLQSKCNNLIMDSGLFTLMFGAHAGNWDVKFLAGWQESIVAFVKATDYVGSVVEVDCQKVLGVKQAWDFREKLRDQLPDHEQINVFHIEDGRDGLDRLIEFSNYIAISVPEMRKARIKKLPQYIQRMAGYVKNKKPDIKIHLLGCTQTSIMEICRFCDSCDSTSWLQVGKYGTGKIVAGGKLLPIKRSQYDRLVENIEPKVTRELAELGVNNADNDNYYNALAASAIELLKWYASKAGSQE